MKWHILNTLAWIPKGVEVGMVIAEGERKIK